LKGVECRGSNLIRYVPRNARGDNKTWSSPVYAGNELSRCRYEIAAGACSLGQDRGLRRAGDPCVHSDPDGDGLPSLRAIQADVLKEWSPIDVGFRNARTDEPATASASGRLFLTSLARVAKDDFVPRHLLCREQGRGQVRPLA
jgi:hypothetical protein